MNTLTITAISIQTGMPTTTIRSLEGKGIVKPERDSTGRRLYKESDIKKIKDYLDWKNRKRPD